LDWIGLDINKSVVQSVKCRHLPTTHLHKLPNEAAFVLTSAV
jgi:hypothetical protein